MSNIIDIEGIAPKYAKTLSEIGIKTTEALLKQGATPKGRKEIEEKTGNAHKLILEWVNLAKLFRIKSVGEEYSDLVEEAGVDAVIEFLKRVSENLLSIMLSFSKRS